MAVREADKTAVADGCPVCVPRQVLQCRHSTLPWCLGVDDPFGADRLGEETVKPFRSGQRRQPPWEAEASSLEGGTEPVEKLAPEHTAEDADRQEEVGAAGNRPA
jgi:hypothetical protein